MEKTSELQLKELLYLEKEFPELLCILEERDHEIKDLTEELDQASARLGYLEWLTKEQESHLKLYIRLLLFAIIPIIILLIILYERF